MSILSNESQVSVLCPVCRHTMIPATVNRPDCETVGMCSCPALITQHINHTVDHLSACPQCWSPNIRHRSRTSVYSHCCSLFHQSQQVAFRLSKFSFNHFLLIFTLLISTVSYTSCHGIFELRLDQFANELNRDASGRCCGNSSTATTLFEHREVCEQQCQTFFRVCFKNYQANIESSSGCVYGERVTPVLHPQDGYRVYDHTIQFPFNFTWPGTFSLIIEVWNNATLDAPAIHLKATRSLVARSFESRRDRLKIGAEWTHKANRINHTVLHYSYRVLCTDNYYGESCTRKCSSRNDNFGHYKCGTNGEHICHPGWSGEYCDKPICRSCNETNGICISPNKCQCRYGWLGENCNQCQKYPNCRHGYCNQPWECICEEGWGGLLCDKDLNYCTNNQPCQNGGLCTNTGEGSFTCKCPPGFAGLHCEIEVDSCEHSPCLNGATCKSQASLNYTCECPVGFYGRHCEHQVSACSSNPCENDGTCVDGPSGFLCVCKLGYSGARCEVRQKDCTPNPCFNGGNCVTNSTLGSDEGGYMCQCRAGFTGDHCEVNINDCESNPCLNSGTCIDEVNSFRCLCTPGFVGELCQVEVDECLMRPCSNGGTCIDRVNDYICICPPGLTGKDCSIDQDDCASNPCLNGGYCQDRINGFECLCAPNYSGVHCEIANGTFVASPVTISSGEFNTIPSTQFLILGSISLPLIAIIISIMFILCKHLRRQGIKVKARQEEEEARRQNEHNAVMNSMNNKCLDQCLNRAAANVIVNTLHRPASLHQLAHNQHYSAKLTNEYVYSDKAATMQKGFKTVNTNKNALDMSVKLALDEPTYAHTYEQVNKPYNLLSHNLSTQQIYQHTKQSNLDIYYNSGPNSDCSSVLSSHSGDPKCANNSDMKSRGNLQNNLQIAATLQRLACRSSPVYVIEDHYSQPIYGDNKKLQATEV